MWVIIDNAVNDSFAAWKCTQVASCRRHSGAASYSRKGEVAHEVGEQEKLGLEFQEFGYEFRKHLGHFRTRLSSGGEYTIEKFNGRFSGEFKPVEGLYPDEWPSATRFDGILLSWMVGPCTLPVIVG